MAAFKIGKGDRAPSLVATLKQAGIPMVLTDCTVVFKMAPTLTAPATVSGSCTIIAPSAGVNDPDCGKVRYDWQAGDTDISGEFLGEFEVTLPSTNKETFPNDEKKKFKVIVGLTVGGP